MNKFLFLIICGMISFVESAEIKAILLCDTKAKNIEKSVAADIDNMQDFLKKISKKTGLNLSQEIFSTDYMKDPFISHIKDLQIKSDDILIFYFSGHGNRTEQKKENPWPDLFLTKDNKALDFREIWQLLKAKKPRLLIAFADCCNHVLPDMMAPIVEPLHAYKSHKPLKMDIANYKRLFLKTKGSIIISGASPGEYSWGTTKGGLFTTALLQSLIDEANTPQPANWRVLLDRAALKVIKRDIGQNPQFELNISE